METIPELKKICQTTAQKDISNVYMRYVCRSISIYITRFLIPTKTTANQVSFAMIITGTLASVFFLSPNPLVFFLGTLVLQFWYILDCVDGEVARYRSYTKNYEVVKEKIDLPMTGSYWDYLNHYIVHGFVPLGTSFGLYLAYRNPFWILVGFVASIFQTMLLAVHDTKSRAFFTKMKKLSVTHTIKPRPQEPKTGETPGASWSIPKWIFVVMHYSVTYPTVMNAATLAAILTITRIFGVYIDFRPLFLIYYAIASALVFLGLAAKNLRDHGLDREFESQFIIEKISS